MENNLFNSSFAKNSKFDKNFVGNIKNINEWLILVNQYKVFQNKNFVKSKHFYIPKKIHQIWLGGKDIPKRCLKWMESWQKFNNDWDYKLWDEESIKELNIKDFDVYSQKLNPGYRSDIIRYIVLKKYGGLYVDTDFECVKKIPDKFLYYKFVAGMMFSNNPIIGNAILMSSPNYMLLEKVLNYIKSIKYKNDINYIIKNSGPETITREYFALAEEIKKSSLILPSNYFYPFPNFMLNKKIDRYDEVEDISVGIHHWEMTWMKGNILNRIKNKLKVIFN